MKEPSRPVIAIVGRPNVGKSSLFNRLSGRRIAIVHEESGVTRDRLVNEAIWHGRRFELIDTGGLGRIDSPSSETIERHTRRQVDVALEDAAAVILVTDVQTGMVPLDEEVAGLLRSANVKVFLAANKSDTPDHDLGAVEFDRLGFPVFPVSATHNRGLEPLMDAAVGSLPAEAGGRGVQPLEVAIVGRPNVGKSSYVNRLLRDERVMVCDVPGTTRDSVEVPFSIDSGPLARDFVLIDTAGIRRPARTSTAVDQFSMMRTESSIRRSDLAVVVIDAKQGTTAQDKKIMAKVLEYQRGCVALVNKWDLSTVTQRKYLADLPGDLPGMSHVPVVFASAKTGYNIRRTIEVIDHVATQVRAQLPTAVLNKALTAACERVQPPLVRGRRFKLYYAVQVGSRPIRVSLFVNDPTRLLPAYSSYLVKTLRGAFGLEGAPVVLDTRRRRAPADQAGPAGRARSRGQAK